MAWEGSDRRERLPPDWAQRVAAVKARDAGRCTWRLPRSGQRCPRPGTEVDHRKNDDDHELRNLQLLCAHHHARKSALEGYLARRRSRRVFRQPEAMPGRLR